MLYIKNKILKGFLFKNSILFIIAWVHEDIKKLSLLIYNLTEWMRKVIWLYENKKEYLQ